jgi:tripartite tricarboxylate transporter family receptor
MQDVGRREFVTLLGGVATAWPIAVLSASGAPAWAQAAMPPGHHHPNRGRTVRRCRAPRRQQDGGVARAAAGGGSESWRGGLFSGQYVARAQPNGSILLFVTGTHSILPGIHRATINFDAVKDLEFISTISTLSFVVSAAPEFSARTFPQLIEMSKSAPGTLLDYRMR